MGDEDREYKICYGAVSVLSATCGAAPDAIIGWLTGKLWTAEEAAAIKAVGAAPTVTAQ